MARWRAADSSRPPKALRTFFKFSVPTYANPRHFHTHFTACGTYRLFRRRDDMASLFLGSASPRDKEPHNDDAIQRADGDIAIDVISSVEFLRFF